MVEPADLSAEFVRLSPTESALSLPLIDRGRSTRARLDEKAPTSTRSVLESIVLDAVVHHPCWVLFSGGRDSSAMLALATFVARREGLPDPVPVTATHPQAPESDESEWQDLVLRHLAISERLVLTFTDQQRLLSPVAQDALQRHGLLWPEGVQLHGAIYRHLSGGALISGEGGDEFLRHRRATALHAWLARPWSRSRLQAAAGALVPSFVIRRRAEAALIGGLFPWLTPRGEAVLAASLARSAAGPLRWDKATRAAATARPHRIFAHNFETAVQEYGLRPVNPFLDPSFVSALATEGRALGLGGRTELFAHLVGDLLPEVVVARTTKASFNQTRWGPAEREFAQRWSGAGVDPELVDPERLRAAWLSDDPPPAADYQLHAAWLATTGEGKAVTECP